MHLTETCDKDMPLIITSVSTTPATTIIQGEMTSVIHDNLADKDRLPNVHFVDSGYTNADNLAEASKIGIDLCPNAGDPSWQARAGSGFDIASFEIDFVAKSATFCFTAHLVKRGARIDMEIKRLGLAHQT